MSTMVGGATPSVRIEVMVEGKGPNVVLVPSASRGAEDFADLQRALTATGYRSLAVNLRGAGKSTPPDPDVTFRDIAGDVACVIRQLCDGQAHVVGHAFGNTVVRATASYHPELVKTVTVMPAGGHNLTEYPLRKEVMRHFPRCHDDSLTREEKLESLGIVFFAPGNDASVWLEGWYPASSPASKAMQESDPEEWWRAGIAPMLVMHPMQDAMLPPESSAEFAERLGSRVTYIEIPRCGHAILPEQPALIAKHLISFLRAHS